FKLNLTVGSEVMLGLLKSGLLATRVYALSLHDALPIYGVSRSQSMTSLPLCTLIGRGLPSKPRRCQSQSLKVKRFGVELISSTTAFIPEQWIVPAGMRK